MWLSIVAIGGDMQISRLPSATELSINGQLLGLAERGFQV
jgi:hypothetical protein